MRNIWKLFSLAILLTLMGSCNSGPKVTRNDTPHSGIAKIAVDESFAPILQEQIDVFQSANPDATIIPSYTSENRAMDLFMKDSMRVLISTRQLSPAQKQIIEQRKRIPRTLCIAVDGVALIINKLNKDSLITTKQIKGIMTGEIKSWKQLNPKSKLGDISVVFDRPNSSIVRYIKDSLCHGIALGKKLKAISEDSIITHTLEKQTPNQKVIDYVKSTPNAIGVIGVNWISNPSDSLRLSFIDKIRVMSISREEKATTDNSYKPYQAYLATQDYPLSRNIFTIIYDVRGGLPSGFVNFVGGQIGQRVILRSGLLPAVNPTRIIVAKQSMSSNN